MSSSEPRVCINSKAEIKMGQVTANLSNLTFCVLAGKYEYADDAIDADDPYAGLNIKYISENFKTLQEALADLARVSDYPWSTIEVKGNIYP